MLTFALFVMVGLVSHCTLQADPQSFWKSEFAVQFQAVQKTPERKDDLEFLDRLVDCADKVSADVALQDYLLDKAFDFSLEFVEGLPHAKKSIQILIDRNPQDRDEADKRLMDGLARAYTKLGKAPEAENTVAAMWFAHGIAYSDRLLTDDRLEESKRVLTKLYSAKESLAVSQQQELDAAIEDRNTRFEIRDLRGRIAARPADCDRDAKRLVTLLMVELNDPLAAMDFTKFAVDPNLDTIVALACWDPAEIKSSEAKLLADWYREKQEDAKSNGKAICIDRRKTYLQRYLEETVAQDGDRWKAEQELDELLGKDRKPPAQDEPKQPPKPAPQPAPSAPAKPDRPAAAAELVDKDRALGGLGVTQRIRQTLEVPAGVTLTILAGTTLEFEPGAGIRGQGKLVARGTEANPIIFQPVQSGAGWPGISLKSKDNVMEWCVVTRALIGLHIQGFIRITSSAFVHNQLGMEIVDGGMTVSDVVVSHSLGDGVKGGQDQFGTWTNVTFTNNQGIGYHGTFKGWPVMKACVITGNNLGGLKCEKGGGAYRGEPKVTQSDIHGNGSFDIFCCQKENYQFSSVFIGTDSSKRLIANPSAVVENIRDGRNEKGGYGIVTINPVSDRPIPGAGASSEVLSLAAKYRPR